MTEIDFETLISEISDGLDRALNGMFTEDLRDVDEAVEEGKENIIREIRAAFDNVRVTVSNRGPHSSRPDDRGE